MLQNSLLIGAVLVASLGGISDLRSARIPNWLTYGGLLCALAARVVLFGWAGLKAGLVGLTVAGFIFLVLFVIGAMGGGDVKLMACVGAWVGGNEIVSVLVAAALAGGLLALFFVIFVQGIRQTVRNLANLAQFHATSGLRPHPALNVGTTTARRVPFGVAIALGTLFCAGNALWWR